MKKHLLTFLLMFVTLSMWTQTNISQGKSATASSSTGNNSPVLAVDGKAGTRWESTQGLDNQWLI